MNPIDDPFIPATEKIVECTMYIGANEVVLIEGENWLSSDLSVNTGDWL